MLAKTIVSLLLGDWFMYLIMISFNLHSCGLGIKVHSCRLTIKVRFCRSVISVVHSCKFIGGWINIQLILYSRVKVLGSVSNFLTVPVSEGEN